MIKKTKRNPIYIVLIITAILYIFLPSCNEDPKTNDDDFEKELNKEFGAEYEDPTIPDDSNVGDIIENLSSPVEMASLIKDNGVPFSLKYLSNPDNTDRYTTKFDQALGLGILGADLGYLNIYNRTSYVLRYITAISKLSEALSVSQFFDFETLKRLATNNENLDSLVYISTSSFNKMDKYLRDRNRSDQSILIITGVWIEAMYMATQVVDEKSNERIAERIGEQKLVLSEILKTLNRYKSKKAFQSLITDLKEVNKIYEKIKIDYQVGEPETVEKDGRLMIIQTETSIVNISQEQLDSIISIIERIRNKRTQLK